MEQEPTTEVSQDKDTNQWAMILHLSLLAGLIVPFAGLIAPIIIYIMKKDSMPGIVPHGYVVFNWMISAFIYAIVSAILMVILIGILGLIAVAIASIVFPIIGAIKASEGEVWPYPLSIKFFK
ncbi:DUF4870 domain-containing protein [Wenzhouxiangella marina]|uniref:Membrane protein n=1 Tax=Wenzhouxiangella marina TaxID=1579979 RepID=A0A0K0XZ78_9GAMM|nr:DUF4870 domain-containing protein [Wenzhouxiangella marina]AKS42937.1 membrane protein [Wenzhouxiangella marina]MBB6087379.1 hypothetical protein [Wenzhouxiangella marina]